MKSKKKKLMYMVTTLALTMSFLLVGVYSAANRQANISGSLTFESSYVWVDYEVEKSSPAATKAAVDAAVDNWTAAGIIGGTGQFDNGTSSNGQGERETQLGKLTLNQKENQMAIAFRVKFTRLTGFDKEYSIKVTLPEINYVTVSVNTSNLIGESGLVVGGTTSETTVIIYFEGKAPHNELDTKTDNFLIKIDLALT